jgi:hypothetical protein
MKWFKKNTPDTEEAPPPAPRNPDNVFLFRLVAVGYVLYTVYKTIAMYVEGGESAPKLWMLCVSTVVLGGGAIFLGIISYKSWKSAKERLQAELEAEAEAELDAEEVEEDA